MLGGFCVHHTHGEFIKCQKPSGKYRVPLQFGNSEVCIAHCGDGPAVREWGNGKVNLRVCRVVQYGLRETFNIDGQCVLGDQTAEQLHEVKMNVKHRSLD